MIVVVVMIMAVIVTVMMIMTVIMVMGVIMIIMMIMMMLMAMIVMGMMFVAVQVAFHGCDSPRDRQADQQRRGELDAIVLMELQLGQQVAHGDAQKCAS